MRVLVYGAGVIGSVFAGKLALAGVDVTVLARGQRYEQLRENGIVLRKPGSQRTERVDVSVISHLDVDDVYDYVIVAMQNQQVGTVLPALSANRSHAVVMVVNTAAGYDEWADAIGKERLMIGFPSAGGARVNGEVHYFIGRGIQRLFQTTTFGEYDGTRSPRVRELIRMFNAAKIPSVFCSDMDAWQKTHVGLVTAIGNALYKFNGDNRALGRSYEDVRDMVLAVKESRAVLRACGITPTPGKLQWWELPTPLLAGLFSIVMRMQVAETTMAEHAVSALPEMLALQREFDVLVKRSG